MIYLVLLDKLFLPNTRCTSKPTNVIFSFRIPWRNEVWKCLILLIITLSLLSQRSKMPNHCIRLIIQLNIISNRVTSPKPNRSRRSNFLILQQISQHNLRLIKQLLRLLPNSRIIKQFRVSSIRIFPSELPRLEEWIPRNEISSLFQIVIFKVLDSKERGFDYGLGVPVDFEFELSGFEERDENFVFLIF